MRDERCRRDEEAARRNEEMRKQIELLRGFVEGTCSGREDGSDERR